MNDITAFCIPYIPVFKSVSFQHEIAFPVKQKE